MNSNRKCLIKLFRAAEWQLNDVAFTIMRGTCSPEKRTELAQTLAALVPLLTDETPLVVEHDQWS